MTLYYGTNLALPIGHVKVPTGGNHYFPDASTRIDSVRSVGSGTRLGAVFSAESAAAAHAFAYSQFQTDNIRVYQVKAAPFHKAPMAIVSEVQKRMARGESIDALVAEYWQPTQQWVFWEYLSESMVVVADVSDTASEGSAPLSIRYQFQDIPHAQKIGIST